jgi:hypothetical protein
VVLPGLWNELSVEDRTSMLQYMVHFTLCCPLPDTLAVGQPSARAAVAVR